MGQENLRGVERAQVARRPSPEFQPLRETERVPGRVLARRCAQVVPREGEDINDDFRRDEDTSRTKELARFKLHDEKGTHKCEFFLRLSCIRYRWFVRCLKNPPKSVREAREGKFLLRVVLIIYGLM